MMSEYKRCPKCKEYSFIGSHVCAPKWYGLHQDDYGDKDYIPSAEVFVDEGMDIYARDAEQAAIKFAELYQGKHSFYPGDMVVLVMDATETKIYKYTVFMEQVPSYSVSLIDDPLIFDVINKEETEEE